MTYLLELLNEHALAIDFAMFLVIWLVQLIVYPVFRYVDESRFATWHQGYCNRISFFVLPLMFAQLIESASACFFEGGVLAWSKMGAVLGAWIVTFFVSAPCHRRLSQSGQDQDVIGRLLFTNWMRTLLWSGVLVISFFKY